MQAEKEEAARRRRQAEVAGARYELARLEQERSPDIDNEVRRVVLCRLADDAATAASEPTKICSAGCGLAENSRMFSKKQWSARAVRRCLACMKALWFFAGPRSWRAKSGCGVVVLYSEAYIQTCYWAPGQRELRPRRAARCS